MQLEPQRSEQDEIVNKTVRDRLQLEKSALTEKISAEVRDEQSKQPARETVEP